MGSRKLPLVCLFVCSFWRVFVLTKPQQFLGTKPDGCFQATPGRGGLLCLEDGFGVIFFQGKPHPGVFSDGRSRWWDFVGVGFEKRRFRRKTVCCWNRLGSFFHVVSFFGTWRFCQKLHLFCLGRMPKFTWAKTPKGFKNKKRWPPKDAGMEKKSRISWIAWDRVFLGMGCGKRDKDLNLFFLRVGIYNHHSHYKNYTLEIPKMTGWKIPNVQ